MVYAGVLIACEASLREVHAALAGSIRGVHGKHVRVVSGRSMPNLRGVSGGLCRM